MTTPGARRRGVTPAEPRTTPAEWSALARLAEEARARAYAPYSSFRVGAALLTHDPDASGEGDPVFVAANVENASYGLCVCAERNAIAAAVNAGARRLRALAVATAGPVPAAPCGMCRQVLAEFARDLPIALVVGGKIVQRTSLRALLPHAFGGAYLGVLDGADEAAGAKPARHAKRR